MKIFTIINKKLLILNSFVALFLLTSLNGISGLNIISGNLSSVNTFVISFTTSDYDGFGVSTPGSSDGWIDITPNGGTPPYTFLWSNGSTTEDISGLTTGIYGVNVIDATGSVAAISAFLYPPKDQHISFPQGWSIFSTYMVPVDPQIDQVFNTVVSNVITIKDGEGKIYWPAYDLNMIGDMVLGEGYFIKTNSILELEIYGHVADPEGEIISLPSGWSILGYIRTNDDTISEMLSPIINSISIVKDYSGMVYWPQMNLNLIGNMNVGEGYQIKMTNAVSFNYPANEVILSGACPATVSDYDGNIYNTVQIGNQCWMKENLKSIHYSDGTAMVNGTGVGNITGDYITQYYFNYNDNPSNSEIYGRLYSWTAMLKGDICTGSMAPKQGACPTGWHIPNELELSALEGEVDAVYGIGDSEWDMSGDIGSNVGGELKDTTSGIWDSPNSGATNSSGFSALPGGYRMSTGAYLYSGKNAYLWSACGNCSYYGWFRKISYNKTTIYKDFINKSVALSVRCIKD